MVLLELLCNLEEGLGAKGWTKKKKKHTHHKWESNLQTYCHLQEGCKHNEALQLFIAQRKAPLHAGAGRSYSLCIVSVARNLMITNQKKAAQSRGSSTLNVQGIRSPESAVKPLHQSPLASWCGFLSNFTACYSVPFQPCCCKVQHPMMSLMNFAIQSSICSMCLGVYVHKPAFSKCSGRQYYLL